MNKRELEVLSIMSRLDKPVTACDITSDAFLSQSTVTQVLRYLLNENMIEISGITHVGTVYSRQYILTNLAKEKVFTYLLEQFELCKYIIPADKFIAAVKEGGVR